MSEKEGNPIESNLSDVWPPQHQSFQPAHHDFLQREMSKIKQSGYPLSRIDLLKRLREEYPLPLDVAVKVLDEFCDRYAPELQKERVKGTYQLAVITLWLIVSIIALIKQDYGVWMLLLILVVLVSVIKLINTTIRQRKK
jgi:hypothetical protein